MRRVKLGGRGPDVSVLCLGTMTWGSQNTGAEGHAQMDQALAAGVNFLDAAEMYPVNPIRAETVGLTETIIGDWVRRTGRRNDWVIATKMTGERGEARGGAPIDGATLPLALDGSLKRLGVERIDLYQLHWPNRPHYHFRHGWTFDPSHDDPAAIRAHMEDVVGAIGRALKAGKIAHWGLSNETAWGTGQWLATADRLGVARPLSIQNEYSLLCRTWDLDLAEMAHNEGLALLAFSPLATGLLSGKYQGDVTPEPSRRALNPTLSGRITPRVFPAVAAYLRVAAQAGLDPVQMAIAWTLTRPAQTLPIIGATTPGQLARALGAADVTLTPEVLSAIAEAHKAHPMPY